MSVPGTVQVQLRLGHQPAPRAASFSARRLSPSFASPVVEWSHLKPPFRGCGRIAATSERRSNANPDFVGTDYVLSNGMIDYYEVLGINDTATDVEIKSAYRSLAKVCHPDISGDERGHNMCILLNEAYTILSDPLQRREYNQALDQALIDESDGYTGEALSKWCANGPMGKNADPVESRAVFVDELTCIGCKQCVWCAPATFRIEDAHGRSRVFAQWVDTEDNIQAAMDACPVSCIHWVQREDLPALEFVTRFKVDRVNVGAMMSGQGGRVTDVWEATAKYLKNREERQKAREKAARYSKAQAAARAAAADDLMREKQQAGWFFTMAENMFGGFTSSFASSDSDSATSSDDDVNEYAGYAKVGRRTRRRRPENNWIDGSNGARVPPERALVPAAVGRKPWEGPKYP